jgi:D-alanyl-lipoteichoic acid acyltransferase DltB (MBOAT superfamily)
MLFNSYSFLFCFLPVTLAGFYALGHAGTRRGAGLWLGFASLFFYGWWNPRYLLLIAASVAGNYAFGVWIARARESARIALARRLLTAGVAANLALLGYYKYAGFLVGGVDAVLGLHWPRPEIALPLAISFFTFTQIAYLVDAWHGITKEYNALHYTLFVTFFPHLIAGPIVLYRSLMPQFARPETYRFQPGNFAGGLTLFTCGLAKKVILADGLAPVANAVFAQAASANTPRTAAAWYGVAAYSLQLLFDFSGYSDMAIGLGRMFNVQFPLNFNSPYKARDVADFWRRWHISLSTFLRDHLYIPLGGNRKGPVRRYVNLFLTMLLGGLWHGAGWTFVLWGALHGLFLVVNHGWLRLIDGRPWAASAPAVLLGRGLTLLAVMGAWTFFRARTCHDACVLILGMAGRGGAGMVKVKYEDAALLAVAAAIALLAPNTQELLRQALPARGSEEKLRPLWSLSPLAAGFSAILFTAAVLHLSRISEFIYFHF